MCTKSSFLLQYKKSINVFSNINQLVTNGGGLLANKKWKPKLFRQPRDSIENIKLGLDENGNPEETAKLKTEV